MRSIELIKIGAAGEQLPADAPDHVAVLLPAFGLMFTRRPINGKAKSQTALEGACPKTDLAGYTDWDMPEIDDLELIIDRSRHSALNTDYFDVPNDWLWTKTGCAWQEKDAAGRSPSAWCVGAYIGLVGYLRRHLVGFALAVRRVGQ